ncbi:MAG: Threonine synthase [Candidatus Gottesmanbacteria bacterium GW2011_GWA2_41_12]|uniref:Threonine synthase n=2 Tax=Candidatus Gottesmaniibacteriota TaxID=1752720 RepID=A0A0G0XLS2_9BACT|nr:MAG: Threonine synthase [Candidatus Gottesmanbacteria bacterium GW2011_GWC2_39_8]KKR88597.1 MAG: Threonine synthase [Candidatus Gottesmanbacteria bacterium GW2011_GWA2_41_12]
MIKQGLGIWKYSQYYPEIGEHNRLTLGEGDTATVDIEDILFKREDQNPTGSVKDRSIAYQFSYLQDKNIKEAAISSSGNAAYSASVYARKANIKLHVFLPENVNPAKKQLIENERVEIHFSKTPVRNLVTYCKNNKSYNLRGSTDPNALYGYMSIAFELKEKYGKIDSIFFPVSSGTTLVGVAAGFRILGERPKIYAVQTTKVCPVASYFDDKYLPEDKSLADAIVARFTPRKKEVTDIIRDSGGSGLVINDAGILKADKWLKNHKINVSYEGAATLAGIWKAREKGFNLGKTVCLLTGKERK